MLQGHHIETDEQGWWVDAWAPDEARCITEAVAALVDGGEDDVARGEAPSFQAVPLSAAPASGPELLVTLLEEVIGLEQVLSLVPTRVHLSTTEDGGLAGDMEVARGAHRPCGLTPRAVSRAGLVCAPDGAGWHCRFRLLA